MKQTIVNKRLSLLLCAVLIAAMALLATGCKDQTSVTPTNTVTPTAVTAVGQGNTGFDFSVTDGEGNTTYFTVNTNQTTVGAALLENNLIAGEDGDYGLYVKQVNGITADYNVDGSYWAFYVNGKYATGGVDQTEIKAGETYAFKVEK
ncbi:MAG: DUF4430 domain-containing protein [Clostridia bacterium]|nr:DUF4430 domain-containing protein [Clostridia bacterium]